MTARRSSKPSFASLLRSMSRRYDEDDAVEPAEAVANDPPGSFRVDPDRVRLWSGLIGPTAEECRDRIAAIVRHGQVEPVTVRPVFDDSLFEYEVIAGARDWIAVRHVRDTAMPDLDLLVRVELVDDDGAGQLATGQPAAADPLPPALPDPIAAALSGETLPDGVAAELLDRLDGPLAPAILAIAAQIARAQEARIGDGLPPYPAGEVMRLLDAAGIVAEPEAEAKPDPPPPLDVSLSIVDAGASGVTFHVEAADDLTPETLARVVKAMIDGAAADGIAVRWITDPSGATSP